MRPTQSLLRRAHYQQNKDVVMCRNRNRRALKLGSETQHTTADIAAQRVKQNGRCYYCEDALQFGKPRAVHVDHHIPLTRGGSNGPENIVLACQSCNSAKCNRMPWEWMPQKFSPPNTDRL